MTHTAVSWHTMRVILATPAGLSGGPARRISVAQGGDASPTTALPKAPDSPLRLETPLAAERGAGGDKGPPEAARDHGPRAEGLDREGPSDEAPSVKGKRKAEGEVMASPLPTGGTVPASGAPKRRQSPEQPAPPHTAALATATKLGDGAAPCTGATTTMHDSAHTVLGKHIAGGRRKIGQGPKAVEEARDMDETVPYVPRGGADPQVLRVKVKQCDVVWQATCMHAYPSRAWRSVATRFRSTPADRLRSSRRIPPRPSSSPRLVQRTRRCRAGGCCAQSVQHLVCLLK